MRKSLKHTLLFWKQKDREPEDVSHHFSGRRCISECELFIYDAPLLKAIVYEWLQRNPGVRMITEMFDALGIHTRLPPQIVLRELAEEMKITLSIRYQMLSADWHSHAEITVNDWLKNMAFEQANGDRDGAT